MSFLLQITKQKRWGNVHQKRIIEENITSHLKFFHEVQIKGSPHLQLCAAERRPLKTQQLSILKDRVTVLQINGSLPEPTGPLVWAASVWSLFKLASLSMILISEPTRKWLHRCVSNHWPTPADAVLLRYLSSWVPWLCSQHSSFLETVRPQIQSPNLVLLSKLLHLIDSYCLLDYFWSLPGL